VSSARLESAGVGRRGRGERRGNRRLDWLIFSVDKFD